MKYIEQIKSLLLTFLALLSIALTLLIWSYKPDYKVIEETETKVEEVLIGEPKELQDVLKPYRLLFRQNDQFFGTVSPSALDELYQHISTWQTYDMDLIKSNLSDTNMNEILRMNNRVTLFFNGEVPLKAFSNILNFYDKDVPEDASFTRLILDWSNIKSKNQLQLLFLNTEQRLLFRAYVDLPRSNDFINEVVKPASQYSPYVEIERDSLRSLYVTQEPIESIQYTYLMDMLLLSTDKFKKIVFTDPNIVIEIIKSEKYTDGTSLMTVDKQSRTLNYVYPNAESIAPIPSSRLLLDSFKFVNEHGGFTADFRFSSMNVKKHITEYQLFLQGYPIYSKMTSTRIQTTWGEDRIYRYRRSYYSIETEKDIPSVRTLKQLPSGEKVIESIRNTENYPFENIDEIVVGYYLMHDEKRDIFLLEPNWFAISNNDYIRILPDSIGGNNIGLE